ncbi:biopolymer transporter ExbD [Microbulbifer agarilyticus]|uniref:ExbD/TolR family protein n=1 Tax=Microbulbifer agarilyticus TaxID=260552 RepID=UPI001C967027|nr:biopolymer transporter ExbD [Microbulbifer agarilyticus]MBY6211662.1 biopolymer transporter ExbD [Microbulbifer agarilyticus]
MKATIGGKLKGRKQRRHKETKLNLVSLMDIFTILVFFLLVNSSDVEVLQTDKTIKLPESTSTQKPETTTVVRVNGDQLMVGNRMIAMVADISADQEQIEPLLNELKYLASRAEPLPEEKQDLGRPVTIMGDEEVPYALLKQIMNTCAAADYRDIDLAVTQTTPQDPAAPAAGQ